MINISLMSSLGYLRASNIRKIIASSSVLITILPFGGHLFSVILIILQNMKR